MPFMRNKIQTCTYDKYKVKITNDFHTDKTKIYTSKS